MTEPSAKIIADSVNPNGDRLTTMEITTHRFVLSEFNTHRMFSRNSASSRAIPVSKQINRVLTDPAFPLSWPAEQKGMQGGEEIEGMDREHCVHYWLRARDAAVDNVKWLQKIGVHKSVTNRLLEPFMWHTIIVTSGEWGYENFFKLRCSPLAQPEIHAVANEMKAEYRLSTPRLIREQGWHLPYIQKDEWRYTDPKILRQISTARCARVSYLTHDGERDALKDVQLYQKLISANPPHNSPLEHVATPCTCIDQQFHAGNFPGWDQLRHKTRYM